MRVVREPVGGVRNSDRGQGIDDAGPQISILQVATCAYLAAAAVLIVPTVALAAPWLTELHRLLIG